MIKKAKLEKVGEIPPEMNGQNPSNRKIIIRTKNLTKIYRSNSQIKAVDNLDLEIYEGETFGLLGPNGAGKTTTVRILSGILKPTSGSGDIKGYDLQKDTANVKAITGLLAESLGVYEKLSAYEFLEFIGGLYAVPQKKLIERITKFLTLFELYDRRNQLLESFSAGMKQKILLAAALIHDPPILYFDEPTNALDPRVAHTVKQMLLHLSEHSKKTIIICSHILPLIEELCDRIGIIHEGKLVAIGTIDEIKNQTNTTSLEEAFIALTGGNESTISMEELDGK